MQEWQALIGPTHPNKVSRLTTNSSVASKCQRERERERERGGGGDGGKGREGGREKGGRGGRELTPSNKVGMRLV